MEDFQIIKVTGGGVQAYSNYGTGGVCGYSSYAHTVCWSQFKYSDCNMIESLNMIFILPCTVWLWRSLVIIGYINQKQSGCIQSVDSKIWHLNLTLDRYYVFFLAKETETWDI